MMIDRVAQAMYGFTLYNADPDDAAYWREKARLAIEAMREPTHEMQDEGDCYMPMIKPSILDPGLTGFDVAGDVWRGMIDAALKET
jgi:hypothetical protein